MVLHASREALDAARDIVSEFGLSGLTTRKIAGRIGYTVGTLYQLFEDADDLIEQMNAETLAGLYTACKAVDLSTDPASSLKALAERYIRYTRFEPMLWASVFEHRLPAGRSNSEAYMKALLGLIGLIEQAISPFFEEGQDGKRTHHARLLWASFYGIDSLASTANLSQEETEASMVETLIEVHLAGLKAMANLTD